MVWVRVRVPARSLFSPLLSVVKVVGFCCGAPPGAPAFCFPAVWGACFLGGAPGGLADVSGGCSAFLRGRRGITFTFFQYSAIMAVVTETNVNGREKRYAEYAYLHCAC